MRAAAAIAAVSVLAMCSAGPLEVAPPLISGAREVTPDSAMLAEYAKAEACTGVNGDVARVHWYVVPGASFHSPEDGTPDIGWTDIPNHGIYVAGDWVRTWWLWKHEAIHDILHVRGHPNPPFGMPCHAEWGYLLEDGT